ncbi:MAG: hypothetical protein LC637_08880 [Xanthomonadaceae bacterium]|nr:hypothetical protein [Xanthomonadaceae bacterium]
MNQAGLIIALILALVSLRPEAARAAPPINWVDGPIAIQAVYTAMVFYRLEHAVLEEFDLAGEPMFNQQQASAEYVFAENEDIRALWQRGLKNMLNGKFEKRFGETLYALPDVAGARKGMTALIALELLRRKHPNIEARARFADGTRVVLAVEEFYLSLDGNLAVGGYGLKLGTPRKLPAED